MSVNDVHPYLAVSASDSQWVREILEDNGIRGKSPFVLIHPGARRRYKSWPLDRFPHIADGLITCYPLQMVLSGGSQDLEPCEAIPAGMKKQGTLQS